MYSTASMEEVENEDGGRGGGGGDDSQHHRELSPEKEHALQTLDDVIQLAEESLGTEGRVCKQNRRHSF